MTPIPDETLRANIERLTTGVNSWGPILKEAILGGSFRYDELCREYASRTVYPPPQDLFRAFELCPFSRVRAVILGQDPYHGFGQAHGLAFSIREDSTCTYPPSLLNILLELKADLGPEQLPDHEVRSLEPWAKNGVLLLNAALSVRHGSPKSHGHLGWSHVADRVLRTILSNRPHVAFLLWGRDAQQHRDLIRSYPQHIAFCSPHPSPFSADYGFFGSRPFSKTNSWLAAHGQEPICWSLA